MKSHTDHAGGQPLGEHPVEHLDRVWPDTGPTYNRQVGTSRPCQPRRLSRLIRAKPWPFPSPLLRRTFGNVITFVRLLCVFLLLVLTAVAISLVWASRSLRLGPSRSWFWWVSLQAASMSLAS